MLSVSSQASGIGQGARGANSARGKDRRAAERHWDVLVCALGEERVLQLGTQVNAQQGNTFAVCKLLDVNVNIASKELTSWLGDGPVVKVLAVQT